VIVADTNLVSYLLLAGERTEEARRVWGKDADWVLPPLWRSEFLNVLATMVRAQRLEPRQTFRVWRSSRELFGRSEREPEAERVLAAAIEHGISAYDAHFVAVAEELAVPLVTCDRALVAACPQVAVEAGRFAK
jgi:predicted nucleic acid-binding protein